MLSISEFKKVYEEIKYYETKNFDERKIDTLRINFLDYYCNRFKDSSGIFVKFDWYAVVKVSNQKVNIFINYLLICVLSLFIYQ